VLRIGSEKESAMRQSLLIPENIRSLRTTSNMRYCIALAQSVTKFKGGEERYSQLSPLWQWLVESLFPILPLSKHGPERDVLGFSECLWKMPPKS
jgi:hypothetical protein